MTGIRANIDMFTGSNAKAMLAVFQGYCHTGIILSDIEFVRSNGKVPGDDKWAVLIIGYCKASQTVVTQQGNPNKRGPDHDRVYEADRKVIRIPVSGNYIDTDMLLAKLAILRD